MLITNTKNDDSELIFFTDTSLTLTPSLTLSLPTVTVAGSLLDHCFTAEIIARYDESWEQFVEDMKEDHQRIIGPTLADKAQNTMFSVGVFEGGQWTSKDGKRTGFYPEGIRDSDHLMHCGVIGYDFDGKHVTDPADFLTPEEFSRRMKGISHFTYSTHGSTPERPKFRAFVAVDRLLVGDRGQEYKDLSRFVARFKFPEFAFDPASFDATRGFFRPSHNSANMDAAFFNVHAGEPLGVNSWLAECHRRRNIALLAKEHERASRLAAEARHPVSKRTGKPSRKSAINYCLAVPVIERNTMLTVGINLLEKWGPDIASGVWVEHIVSRYVSESRGNKVMTEDEVKSTWQWIVEHATTTTTNKQQEEENSHAYTATPARPDA
jgi:hypothetical protein